MQQSEERKQKNEKILSENKGGRPTKLTENWLKVAEEVVNDDINAVILTDEELVIEINNRVADNEKITIRTLQRWKKANKNEEESDEIGERFVALIKNALIKQKKHLFNKFREEPNQWQRWAWILERKFDDWNIRRQQVLSGGITITGNEIKIKEFNDN